MHYCIIGTAGHIDHGKTALIKSLTGIDTDRLKEEKERGISIELGFAYLDLDNGKRFGIVDVPGHERFIKNMVAGAVGMDIVILVVDANEGVMPQTTEHIDILKFLGIKKGIIVITKVDLATEMRIQNTQKEITDLVKGIFLEEAPVVLFSAITGEGKEEIKKIISDLYEGIEKREINSPLLLPIDRVFCISGFGTVVTGTLQKGVINTGDYLEIQPQKTEVRVRNIQIHNEFSTRAYAGQRVAVNLTGVDKEELKRGNWLVNKDIFTPAKFIDAHFTLLSSYPKNLKNRSRIRLHIGTNEVLGRIHFMEHEIFEPGKNQLVQFNLEEPVIASYGDRFVVRAYSPPETIGGGKVLKGETQRHKYGDEKIISYLHNLNKGKEDDRLEYEILHSPFQTYNKIKQKGLEDNLNKLIQSKKIINIQDSLLHIEELKNIEKEILEILKEFHINNPLRIGPTILEITKSITDKKYKKELNSKILKEILANMSDKTESRRGRFKLMDFQITLNEKQNKLKEQISLEFERNLFKPPTLNIIKEQFGSNSEFKNILAYMLEQVILVPVKENLLFHINAIKKAKQIITDVIKRHGKITAAETRDLFGSSRKYAIAILEYLDNKSFTRRIGDDRILVKGE